MTARVLEFSLNKKYGFADHVQILKVKDIDEEIAILLIKEPRTSYFTKTGKARLKMINSYHVYLQFNKETVYKDDTFDGSAFNFTNKSEALKHFNKLVKEQKEA